MAITPLVIAIETFANAAWTSSILGPDVGHVALDDGWVRSHGLPEAQHVPWDSSKGLYVLNGFYNLRCLVCPAVLAAL